MGLLDRIGNSIADEINTWGSGPVWGAIGDVMDYLAYNVLRPTVEAIETNPKTSVAVVVVTVVSGGTALAYAPAIGAAVSAAGFGVAGGTLSGCAASSAGLAAIGGGSLAVEGGGMLLGTQIVTAVGASIGATASGATVAVVNV